MYRLDVAYLNPIGERIVEEISSENLKPRPRIVGMVDLELDREFSNWLFKYLC